MKYRRNYKNVPNKNVTVLLSVLIIFLTSLLTYIFTNIEITFITDKYRGVLIIILGAINTFFGCLPLFYFFSLGGQNWVIKQFMVVLFNALFMDRLDEIRGSNKNNINKATYRITYYKFYSKKTLPLFVHAFLRKIKKNKYTTKRQIDINNDYLLCKYRYGVENGFYDTKKTTKCYALYDNPDIIKGVTSMIYRSNEKTYLCIDNININKIIKKIMGAKDLSLSRPQLIGKSLEENIVEMEGLIEVYNKSNEKNPLSENEKGEVIDFMRKTHTDFNDIFDISEGTHSNHFLGFKVYNQKHHPIGVFTIDAKDPDDSKFEKIVFGEDLSNDEDKVDEKWIKYVLETFSGLTSKSIFDLDSDKEKKDGQRIGD